MKKILGSKNLSSLVWILTLTFFTTSFLEAQSWKEIYSFNPAQTLQKIRFQSSGYGLTVGSLYNGSTKNIHRTIDGGKTWIDVNSGYTAMRFMDIFFLDDSLVFMSGNEGIILKSSDGGRNWVTLLTNTKEQIWGIYFQSRQIGFGVGSNGMILRANNGGNDWEIIPTGFNNLLYAVTFTKNGIGFASGSNIFLRTMDGGDSWNPVSQFPFEAPADWIRSIKFVNNNVGFACADIGRIYKTEDGGDTWVRLNSPTQEALFDVDFIDEKNGMICGFTGTILQTIDGGEHWQKIQSPLGLENLYSIDYVNSNEAYICTHFGKILKLEKTNGLTEWSLSEVKIFPNPFQDNLHLELEEKITSEIKYLSLENVQGQVLFHSPIDEEKINICLSNLSTGIYLLKFYNDENILLNSKKMIKQ